MIDNIQERFEEELHDRVFIWLDQENPNAEGFNVFWDDLRKAIEIQVVDALGWMSPDFLCKIFNNKLEIMYDIPQELHNSIKEFYDKYVFEKESKKDLQNKTITHEEARKELKQILLSKNDVLFDYVTQQEKKDELLGLYQTFHELFSLYIDVESYDDNWGMPADCETLLSNNTLSETSIVDEKMIDLFHQIEQLEKELREMK